MLLPDRLWWCGVVLLDSLITGFCWHSILQMSGVAAAGAPLPLVPNHIEPSWTMSTPALTPTPTPQTHTDPSSYDYFLPPPPPHTHIKKTGFDYMLTENQGAIQFAADYVSPEVLDAHLKALDAYAAFTCQDATSMAKVCVRYVCVDKGFATELQA